MPTVIKTDHTGKEVWRYPAETLEIGSNYIILEAFFNRDDRDDGYFIWQRGDRFVEYFYTDRWYNVFVIHDVNTDAVRGYYCNFTRPAYIAPETIQSDDLVLDLFVYPSGQTLLQDQADFDNLPIPASEKAQVQAALASLLDLINTASPPFDALSRTPR